MAHPNEEMLRRSVAAQERGDVQGMVEMFADDVVAHIGGHSKLAGDFKGKDGLIQSYGEFMGSLGEITKMETHDVLANDTHGMMLQVIEAKRGNDSISINGVGIMHFTNGKVSEVWFIDEDAYTADAWYDAG
jgi:ketosteroid isomerase-like protein